MTTARDHDISLIMAFLDEYTEAHDGLGPEVPEIMEETGFTKGFVQSALRELVLLGLAESPGTGTRRGYTLVAVQDN